MRDVGLVDALDTGRLVVREGGRWVLALLVGRGDSLYRGRLNELDGDIDRATPSWWLPATVAGLDGGILLKSMLLQFKLLISCHVATAT